MLLDEMEIFYHLSVLKSYPKVAKHLNSSKTNVRRKILKLEKHLKIPLIVTYKKLIILTEAGEQFAKHCKKVVEAGKVGYSYIENIRKKENGILKIGSSSEDLIKFLSQNNKSFTKKFPDIEISLEYFSNSELASKSASDIFLYFGKKSRFPNSACEYIATINSEKLYAIYRDLKYPVAKIIYFIIFIKELINKN